LFSRLSLHPVKATIEPITRANWPFFEKRLRDIPRSLEKRGNNGITSNTYPAQEPLLKFSCPDALMFDIKFEAGFEHGEGNHFAGGAGRAAPGAS
jgi:hypothetical protein